MVNSFRGTGVAMVTPFQHDGTVDFEALRKVTDHIINGGVEYLVVLGTTGEAVTLTKKEKYAILDAVVEHTNGRVPIMAGFGGNFTAQIIEDMREYHFNGISAVLSVSPYYNKPNQEGIFRHFMAIAEAAPRPVMLYNVPPRTASNMTAETTLRLANAAPGQIFAVKEASGDMKQVMDIVHRRPDNFLVLSGDDNLTLPMMSFGTDGLISVIGNALPRETSDMVRAALRNDFPAARELHFQLLPFVEQIFADGSPAGVKSLLEILGIGSRAVRLPLVDIREDVYAKLEKLIGEKAFVSHAEQR